MRLAAIPLLAAIIAAVEIRHSPDFFRLISFVLVFLIAADLASLARGALRDALLIVASLLFGLCVIEATAATLEDRQVIVSTNGWNVRRPVIGWGPQHAGRFHSEKTDPKTGAIIYSAEYTIDSNLLRQTRSTDAGSTIAFFGDSVTFGVGVNDPDTLPQRFADVLDSKERVINLAFTGYGPQHFLREMETGIFDAEIGPHPRLFVFVTSPWHAERTSCKASWVVNAPRYELDNGKVAFRGACYEGASLRLREFLWNTAAYRVVFDPYRRKASHDDIETYIRILLAAVDLAKEKYGVPTLIPFLRSPDAYLRGTGFTNEAIMERLKQGGASVIDVSLLKEEAAGAEISIPGDGHPTPLANRMRAAMLKSYIEQNMAGVLYSQLN
ncbi:conserved hypothetical protein [Methylocella tundrae]|uniref:Uncharacterized protein n=1 Tax=Methylocella tundrae TaxID=227605 RepID=A0A8B6MD53_METTU|nr:SGNH/GDSL hydrolase family protein [Methylocella tundrae]VTZ52378.1 conserved hypothetical protein [Methylocella tundrae]